MKVVYKAFFISEEERLKELQSEVLQKKITALIIIGGDGTVHYTLRYIENISIPIGIIPAGSGNDLARALKIPSKSNKALMKVLNGKVKKIDLIYVNGQPSATIVGIGFDAKVTAITNQSKLKQWLNVIKLGTFSYVTGVLRALVSYKPSDMEIIINGKSETFHNVWLIAAANTPFYGGGLKICPDADAQDGTLNLCIVHSLSRFELLMFFPLVFLGKHTLHSNVVIKKGEIIHINCDNSIPVQADGEVIGITPITLTIEKQRLHVIT